MSHICTGNQTQHGEGSHLPPCSGRLGGLEPHLEGTPEGESGLDHGLENQPENQFPAWLPLSLSFPVSTPEGGD